MDDIKETFFQECEELLEELEEGLLSLNSGSFDIEQVNAMFRAVHSIKGGAGAFALTSLVALSHKFETVMDLVRAGDLEVTQDLINIFLRSADALSDLVADAREGRDAEDPKHADLVAQLQSYVGEPEEDDDDEESSGDGSFGGFEPVVLSFGDDDEDDWGKNVFDIKLHARRDLYANGGEPSVLFRALHEVGDVEIICDVSAIPTLEALDPLDGYLTWTIKVETDSMMGAVEQVFEFAADDCDLEIDEREEESSDDDSEEEEPEPDIDLDPVVADDDPEPEPEPEPEEPELKVSETPAPPAEAPKPAAQPEASGGGQDNAASAKKATVRVDLDRVDRLINLVGELVINQAMLTESVSEAGFAKNTILDSGLEELRQLTREIQESVMAIRAQPLKSLFQRMSRIVREAAAATGKTVKLVTEGEMTEVDKTVIERLADPLTHMIRNAVDHGLESTEKRLENGKAAEGIVRLSAAHRSGQVVIDISDDGGGINREKVQEIAVEKGLVSPDATLTGSEIDHLLFMPGFSTAKEVSDLSGRGVGMDVVKRSIQALGGRISINSVPKKGSTFSVSLPLTLAVLDGMIVEVAGQTIVVPLSSIVETLRPQPSEIHNFSGDSYVVHVRGQFVPIVDVALEMKYSETPANMAESVFLLIECDDNSRFALAIDRIQDQRQVVIKGLKDNYGEIPGIAAATILGDGRIALILDPDNLVGGVSMPEAEIQATG